MKKIHILILSLMLLLSVFPSTAQADRDVTVFIDVSGEGIELTTSPIFKNQRIMIPTDSDFFNKLGVVTVFDRETGTITIDGANSTVKFFIGEKNASVQRKNQPAGIMESIEMDVEPFIQDGKVYVPLRFAAEGLGAVVEWDGANKSVLVKAETETVTVPVERPAEYKEIDILGLSENEELYSWVQENRDNMGIYQKTLDNKTYVLVCAGEKPTGGYSVEIESATVIYPGKVYLVAKINEPNPDSSVISVITYPCKLIAIDGDFTVDGVIENSAEESTEEIGFEIVTPDTVASDEELSAWVSRLYTQAGIHYTIKDNFVYALVAAGQRNTGGYRVTIDRVAKNKTGDVYIYATVQSPEPGMLVTQVITWPYTVIRFENTDIRNVHGNIRNSAFQIN
ncbi:copper amine oxidase-like protein [Thermoclostridium stercorarium subsp. stercorarium DSM 8532]|uniref:Copper amine oxidase-like protein n=2 Tax=Thermoclostridium stercorarium TaxID=1510 RepID=L7VMP9_THES1|nr:protease complex subunit PrcB family protein [Thermoclostridium stercorarium]AGC68022.1 copper amine oxidase-like protein [Thermoclostridium stercorarium subsp. stercorarium DSM 8532]AGI39055.1 copper amine oxidase [Thermoclostridium stercorarium subsp. stercorarium DSM 8532]ANW98420.1 copper amine oxidase [Thermoclostridium stercorarium subsp. thermolacticum DSM 2910]